MSVRYFCIINPTSGGGRGRELFEELEKLFSDGVAQGKVVTFDPSQLPAQLEKAANHDRVLVGGGDGTVAAVLGAVSKSASNLTVGIIPLGTANDLARELKVPRELKDIRAEDVIAYYQTDNSLSVQIWQLRQEDSKNQTQIFSNYFSFGFDGAVVAQFSKWRNFNLVRRFCASRHFNRLLYVVAAIRHLLSGIESKNVVIKVDGEKLTLFPAHYRSLIVCNIKCIIGVGVSNFQSQAEDDKIEIVGVCNLVEYLTMIFHTNRNNWLLRFLPQPKVLASGRKIEIVTKRDYALQIDGESRVLSGNQRYFIESIGEVRLLSGSM
jgi:diacylglycerol kinase family enzyme